MFPDKDVLLLFVLAWKAQATDQSVMLVSVCFNAGRDRLSMFKEIHHPAMPGLVFAGCNGNNRLRKNGYQGSPESASAA